MNILVLTSAYPWPSEEDIPVTKVVQYFAEEWAKAGHKVIVIHSASRYPAIVHALPYQIRQKLASKLHFTIPPLKDVRPSAQATENLQAYRLTIRKFVPHGEHPALAVKNQAAGIEKILKREEFTPDIIIAHWLNPQLQLIEELKKIYPCKASLVLHGCKWIDRQPQQLKKRLHCLDALGCRSEKDAEYVREALGLSRVPFICRSGIPDAFIRDCPFDKDKFAETPKVWRFIYVGRLVARKNVDCIIKALSALKDRQWTLDIVGEGNERKMLEIMCQELHLEKKVTFHGQLSREEVLDLMKKSHCFVMVSRGEAFGLVYPEAMLASCITLGSLNEGIDGIIENGKNGFLCTPGNSEELAEVLVRLMDSDSEILQEYAENGYKTAISMSDSRLASQYLANVLSLTAENKGL